MARVSAGFPLIASLGGTRGKPPSLPCDSSHHSSGAHDGACRVAVAENCKIGDFVADIADAAALSHGVTSVFAQPIFPPSSALGVRTASITCTTGAGKAMSRPSLLPAESAAAASAAYL